MATLSLERVGEDDHCGCRVEEYLINGIDLHVHYEDGRADAYLDWGDEGQLEMPSRMAVRVPAPSLYQQRLAVLRWAKEMTQ